MAIDRHQAADAIILAKLKIERSPKWPVVEKAFLAKNPKCVVCGEGQQLNVHHMFPFHYVVLCGRPDLELDPRNLMTLCTREDEQHHVLLGHLDDYESYNPEVRGFVQTYKGQSNQQIRNNAAWEKAQGGKPKHLDQMSQQEKDDFKTMLDGNLPPDPAIVAEANQARKSA
jgi:hypothetical protein